MSLTNTKIKSQGFTIVELLIVVVVIAILAAITIVSYNGITARANASAAKSAAENVQKKAEAYNAEVSSYPPSATTLTSASSSYSYALTGVTVQSTDPTAANGKNTVKYLVCGTNAGAKIYYWDYSTNAVTTSPVLVGDTTGTCS